MYTTTTTLLYLYAGMFYYTITNIDPILRSRLHAIMLLAVANSEVINTYGIDEILKPFVEEVMELESVSLICIIANNTYYTLYHMFTPVYKSHIHHTILLINLALGRKET